MTGRIVRLSPLALLFVLAACGGTRTVTVTRTVTPELITAPVRIYFLRDGKVAPVSRRLPISRESLLRALTGGPAGAERRLGLAGGTGLAEAVYTLSQFDPDRPVLVRGKQHTRSDFEDQTPAILVESPLPFETVHGPELHATGTANTFEATFEYDLVGADDKVLAHHFVTATSGSGTRGTFGFTVPFTVAHAQSGKLVVFESSAENGRRIHVVEIPLRLEP
jgi:hypothetical protein